MGTVAVDYDVLKREMKAFDESKAGVKGLVDAGVTKLPGMFIHPPQNLLTPPFPEDHQEEQFRIPVIDLGGFENPEKRKQIVTEINEAAESWGIFQLVNHGVPLEALEGIQRSIRAFHELPHEEKSKWYSRDVTKKVSFFSCHGNPEVGLEMTAPCDWRDTLICKSLHHPESFDEIPHICRGEVTEYIKHMDGVVPKLAELLSEALGLSSDYLINTWCLNAKMLACHYFPLCPEPHLAMGATKHRDLGFLTLLLQDGVGGLQVRHQDFWIDVPPSKGALLVETADMMEIVTNGRFKSVEHRVLLKPTIESRISIACFLSPANLERPFGPIKELISENNPAIFNEVNFGEYRAKYKKASYI